MPALGIWFFYATAVAAILAGHALTLPATPAPTTPVCATAPSASSALPSCTTGMRIDQGK